MPNAIADQQTKDKLDMIAQAVVANINATTEMREETRKAFNYAQHGSWPYNRTLQNDLIARGLPTLKINVTLPRLLRMFGYARQNLGEITALPNQKAGGFDSVMANRYFQWVNQKSDLQFQLMLALKHAWVGELGGWCKTYFRRRTEFDQLGRGPFVEILTQAINPFACGHSLETEDYNNTKFGRFVFMSWWATPEQILAQFELTEEQEEEAKIVFGPLRENSLRNAYSMLQNWWRSTEGADADITDELWNTKENMARVIQFEERVPKKRVTAWNRLSGAVVQNVEMGRQMMEMSRSGWNMIVQEYDEIMVHTCLGNFMMLQSVPAVVQNGMFSIMPLGAYNISGRNFGMGAQMFGPQEMVERGESAQLAIIGKSATRALFVTKGSMDPEDAAHLEANFSAAGGIFYVKQAFSDPRPVDTSLPSPGQSYIALQGARYLDEISSQFAETRGDQKFAGQPGVVFQEKRQGSNDTMEEPMSHLERIQKMIGEYQLALGQRKLRVGDVLTIAGEEVVGRQVQVEAVVDQSLFDRWQITIGEGPGGKAQMQQEAEQKLALYGMTSPERQAILLPSIIESMSWHDKDEILAQLKQEQAALVPPEQRMALQSALSEAEMPMLPSGSAGSPSGAEEPLQLEAGV